MGAARLDVVKVGGVEVDPMFESIASLKHPLFGNKTDEQLAKEMTEGIILKNVRLLEPLEKLIVELRENREQQKLLKLDDEQN